MKFAYQFVGGPMNNVTFTNPNDAWAFSDGKSEDLTALRKAGRLVHRAELDNQPTFNGYIGPMWNGTREIKGTEYAILRYETQEVYNALSI